MRKLPVIFAATLILLSTIGIASAMGTSSFTANEPTDEELTDEEMTEACAEWMEENNDAGMSECMEMMPATDCMEMMDENTACMEMMGQMGGEMGCH